MWISLPEDIFCAKKLLWINYYYPQRAQRAGGISKGLVISWSWLSLTTLVIGYTKSRAKVPNFMATLNLNISGLETAFDKIPKPKIIYWSVATWLKHLWAQSVHALASCARFMCMRARNITFEPIELQTSLRCLNRGFLGCWIHLNHFQKPNVHLCTFTTCTST